MNRLALGSVQFGMSYGISNNLGQVQPAAARNLVERARASGIDTIDTAMTYGNSEQVLGDIGINDCHIISKLPPLPDGVKDIRSWVLTEVQASLDRLKTKRLYGLLFHQPNILLGPHRSELQKTIQYLQSEGKVGKIGVSIYSPNELDQLYGHAKIELVQCPLNIMDRRIIDSGWLSRLQSLGIEVHTRSAFLQGLLLMPSSLRPSSFERWISIWQTWEKWLKSCNLTPLEACLSFALSVPGISRVVVGVNNIQHLDEILAASNVKPLKSFPIWPKKPDENLINPSLWNI